nr:AAA family ATPase [Pseudomonas schmalbachii]
MKATHVRVLGRSADTAKAQESLDFIAEHAGQDGVAAIADLEPQFPGRQRSKTQQDAMRFDLRHFANSRESGNNPQDKGLIELGYLAFAEETAEVIVEDSKMARSEVVLNQILFGPPGTGKTYATIEAALQVLDPEYLREQQGNRSALKRRFDELAQQDRIRFVTFHQSFSYEDFVEGLRATTDEASQQLRYEVVDGVFKSLCEAAAVKVTQQAEAPAELGQRRIWKMSLGNTLGEDASIYQECLAGGYVLLGYGDSINFSGCTNREQVQARFAEAGVVPENPATDYAITSVTTFVTRMKVGDLVVVSDGNFKFRAIGEVIGDYQFKPHAEFEAGYSQMRPVKWLRQYQPSLPHSELLNGQFSQMTLYELRSPSLDRDKLAALLGRVSSDGAALFQVGQRFGQGYVVRSVGSEQVEFEKPRGGVLPLPLSIIKQLLAYVRADRLTVDDIRQGRVFEKVAEAELEKYFVNGYQSLFAALVEHLLQPSTKPQTPDARVLIIDEINRGSVSRIFGELITLIEHSKRAGADEALSVVLPYSKAAFSVPQNVYLIGTMNTADRSLAGLDIALRRRFVFREMPPRPELLDDITVEGLNIGQLLRTMNQRISVLLDRDHCLGHAYFMPLRNESTLDRLAAIFRNQILPLLQEYFFEDWERIGWVLNDQQASLRGAEPFVMRPPNEQGLSALFGAEVAEKLTDQRWELNDRAFGSIDSYRNIQG